MSDWVHCNVCYSLPGHGKQFSLTNCGHLVCSGCLPPAESKTCKVCSNSCSTLVLGAKMKPEVEIFFADPIELMKKNEKQLLQVMEFQRNHRKKLAHYHQEMLKKQGAMKTDTQLLKEQIQQMAKENGVLRAEIQYLKNIMTTMNGSAGNDQMMSASSSGTGARNVVRSSPVDVEKAQLMKRSSAYGRSPLQQLQVGSVQHTFGSVQEGGSNLTPSLKLPIRTPPALQSSSMSRVSLRTPPSNGRMGIIPPYSSTPDVSLKMPTTPSMNYVSPHSTGLYVPVAPSRPTYSSRYTVQDFMTPQNYPRN